MCQVSCEELGRGSFLERRQAVSRRGDRLRGVGSTSGPERETDALEKVGAEPGSDGQAGAGEAAEQARVLGAAVPGLGLLQVQCTAEGRPRRGAVRGLESL